MTKMNKVILEQVKANMQDVEVKTIEAFGKPMTIVSARMLNGFVLTEISTCADPANYSQEIGAEVCLKKIEDKVWFLLGYELQNKLNEDI